jgi:heptosyltransferase II
MERILWVAPAWVGDVVMMHAALRYLKARTPNAHITVLIQPVYAVLCERMPEVDAVLHDPFKHGQASWRARWRLARCWRGQFDVAYLFRPGWKAALMPWVARIPKRVGFLGAWRYGMLTHPLKLDKQSYPRRVERYLHTVGWSPDQSEAAAWYPTLQVDAKQQAACAVRYGLDPKKPLLMLCPGAAYGASKRWPLPHFIALAQAYLDQGWQVACLGGPAERALAVQWCSALKGQPLDLTATGLTEALDLLALARAVVSNDSGLMHMASSVHRPQVVALYGGTSSDFAPPLTALAVCLEDQTEPPLACRPCGKRSCVYGHYACLNRISVAEVQASLVLHAGDPLQSV